jgi:SAM-dependent methyltransferase
MPAQQGVIGWSATERGSAALVEEHALPFPNSAFDRILMVHGLELSEAERPFMRELWRVLTPEGRLLIVAPNRTSLWAQVESSPFAHGRPFNRAQLDTLLRDTMFAAERWDMALHLPPLRRRRWLGRGVSWEKIGGRIWPALAGVHLVEATKSLYALTPPIPVKEGKRVLASASG